MKIRKSMNEFITNWKLKLNKLNHVSCVVIGCRCKIIIYTLKLN